MVDCYLFLASKASSSSIRACLDAVSHSRSTFFPNDECHWDAPVSLRLWRDSSKGRKQAFRARIAVRILGVAVWWGVCPGCARGVPGLNHTTCCFFSPFFFPNDECHWDVPVSLRLYRDSSKYKKQAFRARIAVRILGVGVWWGVPGVCPV